MIFVYWLKDNQLQQGQSELIALWQQQGGSIWIDIYQESNQQEHEILSQLQCHPLAIQDAQSDTHPPKVERFANNSLILYRGMRPKNHGELLDTQMKNIAFFIAENYLISMHDEEFISINSIKTQDNLAQLVHSPSELLCQLLRLSTQQQLERVTQIESELSSLEDNMQHHGNDELLMRCIAYQTRLRKLKRIFNYQEKIFAQLLKEPNLLPSKDKNIQHSLRDVYDKFERLLNLVSLYYDLCRDLSDGYLSLSSHQLNRTMQVLTVITAIFIPLSFIAGVYGMNFDYMPELHWRPAYFMVLSFMLATALSLVAIFKYKKWL